MVSELPFTRSISSFRSNSSPPWVLSSGTAVVFELIRLGVFHVTAGRGLTFEDRHEIEPPAIVKKTCGQMYFIH